MVFSPNAFLQGSYSSWVATGDGNILKRLDSIATVNMEIFTNF